MANKTHKSSRHNKQLLKATRRALLRFANVIDRQAWQLENDKTKGDEHAKLRDTAKALRQQAKKL